ncbi:MAG: hypothetical protein WCJ97_10335, partial [Phycisphaerae bacterium]
EDLADDIGLVGFDAGDDFHGAAALRAEPRIGVVDAFDWHGPAAAGKMVGGGGKSEFNGLGSEAVCPAWFWRACQPRALLEWQP